MTADRDPDLPHNPPDPPNWRQPFGMILILLLLRGYAAQESCSGQIT